MKASRFLGTVVATAILLVGAPLTLEAQCEECNSITGNCEPPFGRGFDTCSDFGDNCVAFGLCLEASRGAVSVDGTYLASVVDERVELDGSASYGVSCNGSIVRRDYTDDTAARIRERSRQIVI